MTIRKSEIPSTSLLSFSVIKALLSGTHHPSMSLQKKNVIQEFIKDDYVPSGDQFLVKYSMGRGNNLHDVECVDGRTILVSMPKKYRHTVWLKKDDCLVIDPIEEGKKVKGEIMCLLSDDSVRDLIKSSQWPKSDSAAASSSSVPSDPDTLLKFFERSNSRSKQNREEFDAFPSSDSSDVETEEEEEEDEEEVDEDEDEDEEEDEEGEQEKRAGGTMNGLGGSSHEHHHEKSTYEHDEEESSMLSSHGSENVDELTRDRNRSRVQLVTSGVVTVTNVLTEGLSNDIQSLEFEADEEESSDELANNGQEVVERRANTIRIQVNYNANDRIETEN